MDEVEMADGGLERYCYGDAIADERGMRDVMFVPNVPLGGKKREIDLCGIGGEPELRALPGVFYLIERHRRRWRGHRKRRE